MEFFYILVDFTKKIFIYVHIFLESGAEEKDQYKAYGKTFRKMISDCLQKDPTKRPTATELLKHNFFKNKAKDRAYLQKTLVASAPSLGNFRFTI